MTNNRQHISSFSKWVRLKYPKFYLEKSDFEDDMVVVIEDKKFSWLAFIILLFLFILPAIIYALVAGKGGHRTNVFFDENGYIEKITGRWKRMKPQYNSYLKRKNKKSS